MKRIWLIFVIFAGVFAVAAGLSEFHSPPRSRPDASITLREIGAPTHRNIIGIEPYMTAADYQNEAAFRAKLASYLDLAQDRGLITDKSLVVFPEHLSTWLVAANAPAPVYSAGSSKRAMAYLIASNPVSFAFSLSRSNEKDRLAAAVFRANSKKIAKIYSAVFRDLASTYHVTIVAGSAVIEEPSIEGGAMKSEKGALYNTSVLFNPNGSMSPKIIRKAFPIPDEAGFTSAGAPADLPVFATPAGRVGVLICADSWHPDAYNALSAQAPDILAVPGFLQGENIWNEPWRGYVTPWPSDADRSDMTRLSEGEAWLRYSMPARLPSAGATAGMTVFLRGRLWDLGADGRTLTAIRGEVRAGEAFSTGAVTALWL